MYHWSTGDCKKVTHKPWHRSDVGQLVQRLRCYCFISKNRQAWASSWELLHSSYQKIPEGVMNVWAWLHVQQHQTSKAVKWWFQYDGYPKTRLVIKTLKTFSQCSCWCAVVTRVTCLLVSFCLQLLAVLSLFSLCGCTNSASANNYSSLHHVGRCIITADSLWILWRETYNESSENKHNNG